MGGTQKTQNNLYEPLPFAQDSNPICRRISCVPIFGLCWTFVLFWPWCRIRGSLTYPLGELKFNFLNHRAQLLSVFSTSRSNHLSTSKVCFLNNFSGVHPFVNFFMSSQRLFSRRRTTFESFSFLRAHPTQWAVAQEMKNSVIVVYAKRCW